MYLTPVLRDKQLDNEIPYKDPLFQYSGPSCEWEVAPVYRGDKNTTVKLDRIVRTVLCNVNNMR